jgi:hypothetical protein
MEVAVVADGTSADKKKRMRLANVASSVVQVTIGQSKGVLSSRELCTVKCRHIVLLCQMPDTLEPIDCTASLQRLQIRAGSGKLQYEPKLLQLWCNILVAHEAPRMSAL